MLIQANDPNSILRKIAGTNFQLIRLITLQSEKACKSEINQKHHQILN